MKGSVGQSAVSTMTLPFTSRSGDSPPAAGSKILSVHSWMRIASVLIVILLALVLQPQSAFVTFVFVFSSVHYTLAAFYGRHRIAQALSSPREAFGLVLLTFAALLFFFGRGNLFLLFGIHHVLNEVYLLYRGAAEGLRAHTRSLRLSAIVFNSVIYVTLLRHTPPATRLDENWLFAALAVSCVFFFANLALARRSFKDASLADLCLFEVLGLIAIAASFFVQISLLHVVMYHFIFWSFYPVQSLARQGRRPVIQYVCLNLVLTGAFFLTSPASPFPLRMSDVLFMAQFRFWSMLHILTSFSLSAAHPVWIRKLLQPRPLVLSAKTG